MPSRAASSSMRALPAMDGEAVVSDGDLEVLAGLVLADDLADLDSDRRGASRLAATRAVIGASSFSVAASRSSRLQARSAASTGLWQAMSRSPGKSGEVISARSCSSNRDSCSATSRLRSVSSSTWIMITRAAGRRTDRAEGASVDSYVIRATSRWATSNADMRWLAPTWTALPSGSSTPLSLQPGKVLRPEGCDAGPTACQSRRSAVEGETGKRPGKRLCAWPIRPLASCPASAVAPDKGGIHPDRVRRYLPDTARAWHHSSEGPSAPDPGLRRPVSCVRDVTRSLRNTLRR
jgi:hypothetical protein